MPHFITDTCVGCTICALKCPTGAIAGERITYRRVDERTLHIIGAFRRGATRVEMVFAYTRAQ